MDLPTKRREKEYERLIEKEQIAPVILKQLLLMCTEGAPGLEKKRRGSRQSGAFPQVFAGRADPAVSCMGAVEFHNQAQCPIL